MTPPDIKTILFFLLLVALAALAPIFPVDPVFSDCTMGVCTPRFTRPIHALSARGTPPASRVQLGELMNPLLWNSGFRGIVNGIARYGIVAGEIVLLYWLSTTLIKTARNDG